MPAGRVIFTFFLMTDGERKPYAESEIGRLNKRLHSEPLGRGSGRVSGR